MLKIVFTALLTGLLVTPAYLTAEITSQPCPYSCRTRGLEKSRCKDWREGNTCYVDDMQPASAQNSAELERSVVMVNKKILAGQKIEVSAPKNSPIDHLDAVVKREGGSSQTQLSFSIGDSLSLGTLQVDQNSNHVARVSANGTRPEGRKLVLRAENGDVFVESVHFLFR